MRIITDLPSINIEEPTDLVVAHAKQSDKLTRWFRAPLLKGADPWTPPTNGTATIKFLKADGHSGWYDCLENGDVAVEVDGTNVIFGMAAQALSAAGRATVSIEWFTPAGERISGFNLYIDVEVDPNPDAHIVSTDYYNVLSVQVAAVLSAAENLTGIEVDSTTLAIGANPTVSVTGGGTQPYTIHFGIPAGPLESLTAEAHGLPTGSNPTVEVTGGGLQPFHLNLGVPVGSVGPAGIAVQDSAPTSNELVWIDTDESPEEIIVPEVNDSIVSDEDTWSSEKISNEIAELINDSASASDSTWSSTKIETAINNRKATLSTGSLSSIDIALNGTWTPTQHGIGILCLNPATSGTTAAAVLSIGSVGICQLLSSTDGSGMRGSFPMIAGRTYELTYLYNAANNRASIIMVPFT